jgi:uncharacterized protein
MVLDNLKAFPDKFNYQISSGRLLITFGFFLLGMFVGRMRWFENLEESKSVFKRIWKRSGLILLITLAVAMALGGAAHGLGVKFDKNPWTSLVVGTFADVFNSGLTIFYIASFTLLMYRPRWRRWLWPLASVGKMALTSYLMQTVIGLLLFFSFGLGLLTQTSAATNALLSVGVFGLQIAFSSWWLKRFEYGPVEWLWRSATLLQAQAMVKPGAPEGLPASSAR